MGEPGLYPDLLPDFQLSSQLGSFVTSYSLPLFSLRLRGHLTSTFSSVDGACIFDFIGWPWGLLVRGIPAPAMPFTSETKSFSQVTTTR